MMAPSPTLHCESYRPLSFKLAQRIACCPADVPDLSQEGLWSLHRALQKTPAPDHPYAFARRVMLRAMYGYYQYRHHRAPTEEVSFDTLGSPLHAPEERQEGLLDLDCYLQALRRECGEHAHAVAQNLLTPQPKVVSYITADARTRARRTPRAHRAKATPRVLRAALGLTMTQWKRAFADVQTFTRRWLHDYAC